jgi:hypothetical protein
VLKPRPHGVAEVERQVLYDEEVICRSSRMARELLVLEPDAGVGIPVIPGYVGRSPKMRGECRILYALAKGLWTPLDR